MRAFGLAFWVWSSVSLSASACDIRLPKRDTIVQWPERILVAEVKVVQVKTIATFDRYARVRLIKAIRGELPPVFSIRHDTTSCGSHFTPGGNSCRGLQPAASRRTDKRLSLRHQLLCRDLDESRVRRRYLDPGRMRSPPRKIAHTGAALSGRTSVLSTCDGAAVATSVVGRCAAQLSFARPPLAPSRAAPRRAAWCRTGRASRAGCRRSRRAWRAPPRRTGRASGE